MAYSNVPIGTSNPGCIVILVDQSLSMSEDWGEGTKAEKATQAVNNVLGELVLAGQAGDKIRDRCYVSVIGYGERVECIVDGMISKVALSFIELTDEGMPIWVQPTSNNGTPMHKAFESAARIVQSWCDDRPDSFPPIVINVTDGEANRADLTADAARKVMDLRTTDGNVLVFNVHIANDEHNVIFPHSTTQLLPSDFFAEFLFDISSVLPEPLREAAKAAELPAEIGTRCFAYNADSAIMINILNFGSLGVTGVRHLPPPLD